MKNKTYKRIAIIALLLVSIYVKSLFSYTLAKYISDETLNYYVQSQGFYLNSDKLASLATTNINKQWDGSSVHFEVNNSLNDEISSEFSINYTATCSITGDAKEYAKCTLNGTDSNIFNGVLSNGSMCKNNTEDGVDVSGLKRTECEVKGYSWYTSKSYKDLYFDVELTDNTKTLSDVNVNIIVNSTSPYEKQLSGDFILHKVDKNPSSVLLSYKSFANYDKLIVSNSFNSDKCMKIVFNPSDAIMKVDDKDISSFATNEDGYINEITFKIKAKNSLSYVIQKQKEGIDEKKFTISESNECK